MEVILSSVQWQFSIVYLDGIVKCSKTSSSSSVEEEACRTPQQACRVMYIKVSARMQKGMVNYLRITEKALQYARRAECTTDKIQWRIKVSWTARPAWAWMESKKGAACQNNCKVARPCSLYDFVRKMKKKCKNCWRCQWLTSYQSWGASIFRR